MGKYSVLLHGRDLMLLDEHGGKTSGGVYAWRSVEATSTEQAILLARQRLLADPMFLEQVWSDSSSRPAQIVAEQVEELDDSLSLDEADSACIFYLQDENSDSAPS